MSKIMLSGWLPDTDRQGITPLADTIAKQAKDKKRKDPIDIVVMGIMRVDTVKEALDDSDKEPVYTMKFVALEPVADPDENAETRERVVALREHRIGVQDPIPGSDDNVAPLPMPGD